MVAFIAGSNLPSAGLTLLAVGLGIGGVSLLVMSRWMQAVTLPGAMIRAMLAAYRRTLDKTMRQARSMDQVVAESGLAWLETPDQAVVWGVALGLDKEVEDVLERSLDDLKDGRTRPARLTCRSGTAPADGDSRVGSASAAAAAGCSRRAASRTSAG